MKLLKSMACQEHTLMIINKDIKDTTILLGAFVVSMGIAAYVCIQEIILAPVISIVETCVIMESAIWYIGSRNS